MSMSKSIETKTILNDYRRMVEIGYLAACQTYYRKLVANVSIYDRGSTRTGAYQLEAENFTGALLVLFAGAVCSTIAFLVELWARARTRGIANGSRGAGVGGHLNT